MVKREAPYGLVRPCDNCPFRTDVKPYLTPARVRQLELDLERREFHCHKTLDYSDGQGGKETPRTAHCAGALILLEKMKRPSQMMRIAERLKLYDYRKLDYSAPVYDSWDAMREAMRTGRAGGSDAMAGRGGGIFGWRGPRPWQNAGGADDDHRGTLFDRDTLLVCIFCGDLAAGTVSGHAVCSRCKRIGKKGLESRSRTVSTRTKDYAIFTWETDRTTGKAAMGTIQVEVLAGPNGGRVNVEVVKGDKRDLQTPRASRYNILRSDTARALAKALADAADLADATPATSAEGKFSQEPSDADRVPAREVSWCARCTFRPAVETVGGTDVCEKCKADVVIEADSRRTA